MTQPAQILGFWMVFGSSALIPSSAQKQPQFPPPVAGTYTCVQLELAAVPQMTLDPYEVRPGGVNTGGFSFDYTASQAQLKPSSLGKLIVDGKGNYQVTGFKAKGTYKFDAKTNRLNYGGALSKLEQPGYSVSSKGTFSISFEIGGARNYCELTVKGNPLPVLKSPNGNLPGRLYLSSLNGTDERNAGSGKLLGGFKAPLGARDFKGRWIYFLEIRYGINKLVVEDKAGKPVGGFEFEGYQRLSVEKSWASLSPDGFKVALVRGCALKEGDIFSSGPCLTIINPKDAQGKVLSSTDNMESDGGPAAWTLDGRILYSGKDGRLYVADSSFKNQKRLTEREGRFPAVSPDGKRVVYISGNALMVMNLDRSGVKKIDQGADAETTLSAPAWSPDGKSLVSIVGGGRFQTSLWLNPLEGNRKGYLLTDENGLALNATNIERLSWWAGK